MENFDTSSKSLLEISPCLDMVACDRMALINSSKEEGVAKIHCRYIAIGRVVEFIF